VTSPPAVVLVEDTPEIAELLSYALRDRGFDVVVTGFTVSLGDLVARAGAAAVVLDCSTLDMSESLFDALRADSVHAGLPVVLVSDTPAEADAALAARRAERVLLVPKPFTGAHIARALGDLLAPAQAPAPSGPAR